MALLWWFIVEWLLGAMSMVFFTRDWLTCGRPPRDKEIEVTPSLVSLPCSHKSYGLCLDWVCWVDLTGRTSRCRGGRRYCSAIGMGKLLWKIPAPSSPFLFTSRRSRSEWADGVLWWTCTTSAECQSKYLDVSPVTDNSEQLNKDVNGGSHHSNFSKLKFCWVNQG